jgi:Tol biopolymer transport system component
MILRILIIAFLILSINLSGCSQNTRIPENFDPRGKIVYIEDLSGKSGLTDFNFGDLVILDPETKEKIVLTRDRYYNAHPSWSPDGDKIVFESKRVGAFTDASTQSNLFIYYLHTGEIVRLDEYFSRKFPDIIEREYNQSPAWSNDGRKIAFVNRVGARGRIIIYDIEKETLEVVKDEMIFKKPLRWSSDDKNMIFGQRYSEADPDQYFHYSLILYNIENKKYIEIGDPEIRIEAGNKIHNRVFYIGWSPDSQVGFSTIYIYDINNDSTYVYYNSKGMDMSDVITDEKHLYFLGTVYLNDNGYLQDIYRINLSDFSFEQITFDGHEKMDMDIFRMR